MGVTEKQGAHQVGGCQEEGHPSEKGLLLFPSVHAQSLCKG